MNGILCIDKPQSMTSFACCALARRLLGVKKVGHAGTLDPMATGVLPLLVGKASRALDLLPCHDKRYRAVLRFGYTSDTLDIWGSVTPTGGELPHLTAIEAALPALRGEILQTPPMTSALKQNGIRLYELARKGIEVERKPRPVTVHSLEITGFDSGKGELSIECFCSKGTYIRSICDDLGHALGCGAVMTALRRTEAAGFALDLCITPDEAKALSEKDGLSQRLIPVDNVFSGYPKITVTEAQAVRFQNGGALSLDRLPREVSSDALVYAPNGSFIGIGRPKREELVIVKLF